MRKLSALTLGLLLSVLVAVAPARAVNCTSSTITATGAGSCTVPAGVTSIAFKVWGGGASGNGTIGSQGAGGGGGECNITLSVTHGNTVYYTVAATVTGVSGNGSSGNTSWINISSNAQPGSGATGCYATGGVWAASASNAGGTGNFGTTNFTGGQSYNITACGTAANGAGSNISFGTQGVAFGTGITYCVTTGIADNDTTAPAATTFLVNLDWN